MKKLMLAVLAAAALIASPVAALAAYPEKPVKFVVTFPAGGMTDLLARNVANELAKRLGQPVVIDNRGGMGGSIGGQVGAKAPADGYTFTFANVGAMTLNTVIYKDIGYDPLKDFVPVVGIAAVPNVVAVPANSPYKTLAELVEDARRNPGKLSYASTGTGASPWMGSELLKSMAKIDVLEIPFKGAGPALMETIAGRTAFVFDAVASSIPQIKGGKIRALGVSSAKRVAAAPEIPTIAEQGYPGFDVVAWYGLWAPAGTPPDVVQRVNREVQSILKSPEMQEKFNGMGAEIMSGSVEEFTAYHRAEYDRWTTFLRNSGIKPQ
jgi:tripartite-type tricarboxylate transporter receptor subunit TctC